MAGGRARAVHHAHRRIFKGHRGDFNEKARFWWGKRGVFGGGQRNPHGLHKEVISQRDDQKGRYRHNRE